MAGFTAIAAGVGLATKGITTGLSFGDMAKSTRKRDEANLAAAKSLMEADKMLDINVYDKLGIAKEPFELEREALLQQGATALQRAVEGETRGAAAAAGRIQQAMTGAQAGQRAAMGQELMRLKELSAAEEGRLRDMRYNLELEKAAGAQQAAAQFEMERRKALQEGVQGAVDVGVSVAEMVPLYKSSARARQAAAGQMEFGGEEFAEFGMIGQPGRLTGNQMSDLDFEAISEMSPKEYRLFEKSLTPRQTQLLFGSQQFGDLYVDPSQRGGFVGGFGFGTNATPEGTGYQQYLDFLEFQKSLE